MKPEKEIHLICFKYPFPPEQGGTMDSFFRLKALAKEGVKIHFHCFLKKGETIGMEIVELCATVHTYSISTWRILRFPLLPMIVSTRMDHRLKDTLLKDRLPVLFDGLHTTGWLRFFDSRDLVLRAHNVESEYYKSLIPYSKGIKLWYLRWETARLEEFEQKVLSRFTKVLAISPGDADKFKRWGGNCITIPIFHGFNQVTRPSAGGTHILYQGDLSLPVNQEALLDLFRTKQIPEDHPIVVAGRKGSDSFEDKIAQFPNLHRMVNVSSVEMKSLVETARVVIVPSLHSSGMKQKLFPPLYMGKKIVASPENATNTPVDQLIEFVPVSSFRSAILKAWTQEISQADFEKRKSILEGDFSDQQKAKAIIRNL